jgi:hypothetical protein
MVVKNVMEGEVGMVLRDEDMVLEESNLEEYRVVDQVVDMMMEREGMKIDEVVEEVCYMDMQAEEEVIVS